MFRVLFRYILRMIRPRISSSTCSFGGPVRRKRAELSSVLAPTSPDVFLADRRVPTTEGNPCPLPCHALPKIGEPSIRCSAGSRCFLEFTDEFLFAGRHPQYLAYRLRRADCTRPVFADNAIAMLHEAAGSCLREIDRVATACLKTASRRKKKLVDRPIVASIAAVSDDD